jgi:predicted nicotinamide N-methyase
MNHKSKKKKSKKRELAVEDLSTVLIKVWRHVTSLPGPNDQLQTREFKTLVNQFLELNKLLSQPKNSPPLNDWTRKRYFTPYLLYHWFLRFQEAKYLINDLHIRHSKVLDLSCGLAPYALACADLGSSETWAIDNHPPMLNILNRLSAELALPLNIRRADVLKPNDLFREHFDFITLSHSLCDLFPDETQDDELLIPFIEKVLSSIQTNGSLLITENATVFNNRRLMNLKEKLTHKGISIQAPCICSSHCPALHHGYECITQKPMEKTQLIKDIHRSS